MKIQLDLSDAYKILDALRENELFHRRRDEMNSQVHLAKEVRYSPITTTTQAAVERLFALVNEVDHHGRCSLLIESHAGEKGDAKR